MPLARCVALVLLMTMLTSTRATEADLRLNELQLPRGFTIELLARVPNARAMARARRVQRLFPAPLLPRCAISIRNVVPSTDIRSDSRQAAKNG